MRLTLPHYFDFGQDSQAVGGTLDSRGWDALRVATNGAFAMARSRDELEAQADARPEIGERAASILSDAGSGPIVSYGAGAAVLEAWLIRHRPGLELTMTDFAPATVETLQGILPEARVRLHDLRKDAPLAGGIHLFHRIDTEFSNREWRSIFRRFEHERILFVPGGLKSDDEMREVLRSLYRELRYTRRIRGTRAGRIRTAASFERLWHRTHRGKPVRFHDLSGWALR